MKIKSPNQVGKKGIPPGLPSGKGKRSGIISPNQFGKKGQPGKAHFPGDKPARD